MTSPFESSPSSDELGMTWWNGLTERERREWMARAGNTGVAADAWAEFQKSPINAEADHRETSVREALSQPLGTSAPESSPRAGDVSDQQLAHEAAPPPPTSGALPDLFPAERMALTVALAQVREGRASPESLTTRRGPPVSSETADLCVTCHQHAPAEGCTQCDRCMDEANRLWQHALHLLRMSVAADEAARKAQRDALDAFRRFNEANCTATLSQQSSMRTV